MSKSRDSDVARKPAGDRPPGADSTRRTCGHGDRTAVRNGAAGAKAVKAMRDSRMSRNVRFTLGVLAVAAATILGAFAISAVHTPKGGSPASALDGRLVRPDSHRLSTAVGGKVTVVEFLDFECESCGAAYPGVEKLRQEYKGKINYVVRFFPLPMHRNADNAARAVQAAAAQNRFESMYAKMFDTQGSWGDQRADHAATFEQFAAELGLDMARYRADVIANATRQRVNADRKDGLDLGVKGTPTFYINGVKFDDRPTYENLKAAIDVALAA